MRWCGTQAARLKFTTKPGRLFKFLIFFGGSVAASRPKPDLRQFRQVPSKKSAAAANGKPQVENKYRTCTENWKMPNWKKMENRLAAAARRKSGKEERSGRVRHGTAVGSHTHTHTHTSDKVVRSQIGREDMSDLKRNGKKNLQS